MSYQPPKDYAIKPHLRVFMDTGHPVIIVSTNDETRLIAIEKNQMMSQKFGPDKTIRRVYKWSATGTLSKIGSADGSICEGKIQTVAKAVEWFIQKGQDHISSSKTLDPDMLSPPDTSILFIMDAMSFLQEDMKGRNSSAVITRTIKDAMMDLRSQKKMIILVGNSYGYVPPELKTVVPYFEYPDPDEKYLYLLAKNTIKSFPEKDEAGRLIGHEELEEVAKLLLGMNSIETQNALAGAIHANIKRRRVDPLAPIEYDRDFILQAKIDTEKDNPALRVIMPKKGVSGDPHGKDVIGGAYAIKEWFLQQKNQFSEEAKEDGIDPPKGAVIFGMGGVGKDLFVEQMAQEIGWPLIHVDFGAAMGSKLGESHSNVRRIIHYAESQAPCFLAMSEWEKTMSGAMTDGSAASDGGVRKEILATWLNWMSSRTANVFVWGLTNDISSLSQASLRAGRWDCVWFMDLPSEEERVEIFSICLKKRGWGDEGLDLKELSHLTEGYSGAEINAVVNKALSIKFSSQGSRKDGVLLTQDHIKEAIPMVTSTVRTRGLEVEALRQFAKAGGYLDANARKPKVIDADLVSKMLEKIKE
jgi:AAA+ superfamily predicted ATPase